MLENVDLSQNESETVARDHRHGAGGDVLPDRWQWQLRRPATGAGGTRPWHFVLLFVLTGILLWMIFPGGAAYAGRHNYGESARRGGQAGRGTGAALGS